MYLTEAFKLNDTLNPKLWLPDNNLKPEVYTKLLETYKEFIKFIDIPLNIVDVEIIGSNASYNYNDKSDIDLHIIVNNEINYMYNDLLQQFYNAKKNLFNETYSISIEGIPVELYIEDIMSTNATNGRYSILKQEWVMEPKKINYVIPDISKELEELELQCNDMLLCDNSDEVLAFINNLFMMRKLGLSEEGEISKGNLLFKELRNLGIIDKLKDTYYNLRSMELTI